MSNKEIGKYCVLGAEEEGFLRNATTRLDLSTRAYFRILKLARTIADIDGADTIGLPHLAEALSYRKK